MKKIKFQKIIAAGNDFIVIDEPKSVSTMSLKKLAVKICDRKYGVGADGLLVVSKQKNADIKMRIFNSDGSEAEMCGNGSRCAAIYAFNRKLAPKSGRMLTRAGSVDFLINPNTVRVKLTKPKDIKTDFSLNLNGRKIKANFINTGVPHVVVFVENLGKIDVFNLGRYIRNHNDFKPKGTNVNFCQITGENSISVRTYERGVEDETFACGTGSVASALLASEKLGIKDSARINVRTKSGEMLSVFFEKKGTDFESVWLEGRADVLLKGEFFF